MIINVFRDGGFIVKINDKAVVLANSDYTMPELMIFLVENFDAIVKIDNNEPLILTDPED